MNLCDIILVGVIKMIIDEYYNYVTLMVFELLYKYENKKSISVELLHDFRNKLLDEILDVYQNGKGHNYLQKVDQWEGEITFRRRNEQEALEDFLDEYEEYFTLNNGIISLKENVNYNTIDEFMRQIRVREKLPSRFEVSEDTPEILNLLGIKSIENVIIEYLKIEEQIEILYNKLYTSEDSIELRNKIRTLLFWRFRFFYKLSQMPKYTVDAFRNIISHYQSDNYVEYDKCPINMKMWTEEFCTPEELEDPFEDIDDRIYDLNQYAIFGSIKNNLNILKFTDDLDIFYFSKDSKPNIEEMDPTKDYSDMIETDIIAQEQFDEISQNAPESIAYFHNPTDEFFVLFMNYLNNLNKFMENYGESEELLLAKKRLLYVLDKPKMMLFDEKNFQRELEKAKNIEIDEESFDFFKQEIYFLAQEVFEAPCDEFTIRKLLLIKTYYELTSDEELKETIENYKTSSSYETFYNIMFNNIMNNNLSDKEKELILKVKNNKGNK